MPCQQKGINDSEGTIQCSIEFSSVADPDLDPYQREKLDLDPHLSEKGTQIPIK
jgi:hypothetical protein